MKELRQELTALLYDEIDSNEVKILEGIEKSGAWALVKGLWGQKLGHFFIHTSSGTTRGR